jgi:hypothetical protein
MERVYYKVVESVGDSLLSVAAYPGKGLDDDPFRVSLEPHVELNGHRRRLQRLSDNAAIHLRAMFEGDPLTLRHGIDAMRAE